MKGWRLVGLLLAGIVFGANAAAAAPQGDLTPIRPGEEQARRPSVSFGFRPIESAPQEPAGDILPPPQRPFSTEPQLQEPEFEEISPTSRLPVADPGEEIRQRYPDGSTQILRHVRQDADGNYVNHGPWKLFNRSGQILAEGSFADGLMHGPWSRWHPDGDPAIQSLCESSERNGPYQSTATFVNGKLDGSWTIYDRLRRKIFEMQYVDGVRDGSALWWSPGGELVREARFARGVLDGRLVEYDSNQRPTRDVTYVDGQRVYSEVSWYSEGKKKSEDFYLDGRLELEGEDDWWDARTAEYVLRGTPLRHGATRAWYENGQLKLSGQFERGERNGMFTWWHANGQRQLTGEYEQGARVGEWTWWHDTGMKSAAGRYEHDAPVGEWTYWDIEGKVVRRSTLGSDAAPLETLDTLLQEPLLPNAGTGDIELHAADDGATVEEIPPPSGVETVEQPPPLDRGG